MSVEDSLHLCERCQAFDIRGVFAEQISNDSGRLVLDLKSTIEDLRNSKCSLCRLFAAVAPSDIDTSGRTRHASCHVRAFSSKHLYDRYTPHSTLESFDDYFPPGGNSTLLGVVRMKVKSEYGELKRKMRESLEETGYLALAEEFQESGGTSCLRPYFRLQPINREAFPKKFITECLAYCKANHEELNGDEMRERSSCKPSSMEFIDYIRVIDCRTRKIVQVGHNEEIEYAALSYVWGSSTTAHHSEPMNANMIENPPKVVTDSIEATLALGLNFLWIDRYCINQQSSNDKHKQIAQMDVIYRSAQLTIIAAAGAGPEYGLPGVGGTARRQQPFLTIGQDRLISTLPHPERCINRSKWISRAWTYQEGILSKRRLIFTDDQVLFECNAMNCAEVFVERLNTSSKAPYISEYKGHRGLKVSGAFKWKAPGNNPRDFMRYVSQYSHRQLSFPEDALNAMQGIFRAFKEGEDPVYELMGVPFVYSRSSLDRSPVLGLSWFHTRPGKRRLGFPSWSWAGWEGKVAADLMCDPCRVSRLNECTVQIGSEGCHSYEMPEISELPEFLRRLPACLSNRLPLIIHGTTFECHIINFVLDPLAPGVARKNYIPNDGWYVYLKVEEGVELVFNFYPDCDLENDSTALIYTGIILGESFSRSLFILVVEEGADFAERVGCFSFQGWYARVEGHWKSTLASFRDERKERWNKRQERRAIRVV